MHGRIFKKDGVSSFAAGSLSAQVSANSSPAAITNFTIYATGSVMMESYVSEFRFPIHVVLFN